MDKIKHDLAGLVEETAAAMRRVMTAEPARDPQQAAAQLFEGMMETNKRFAEALLDRAEPGPAVELQRRFVGEYFDALTRGGALLVSAAEDIARQASQRTAPEPDKAAGGGEAAPSRASEPAPPQPVRQPRAPAARSTDQPTRRKAVR